MNAGAAVSMRIPDFADVVAAAARLAPHVVRTPVTRSTAFDARCGREVCFKCENLQVGGAFKYRGAMNVLLQLDARRAPRVITHSSGNHGNALALAARSRGMSAIVIVPRDSARSKIAAIEAAGARIELCDPGLAAREKRLAEILAHEPAQLVHPFDDDQIIAGQGTAALELIAEVQELDVIATPVGGGGLIGGTALAAKAMLPRIKVVGAEPEQADDAYQSFRSGQRHAVNAPQTLADGLRGSIGLRNFELLRSHVDDVVTVSEAEIVDAMRVVMHDLKLVIEPSSAVPVAAALAGRIGKPRQRVGIVLSGGNIDLSLCPFLRGESVLK
jgi:threonine dehydratase